MAEMTINDTQLTHVKLNPDGPVEGAPQWSVVSGNGTLLGDPASVPNMPPESAALWDASLPEGYQMFLVSDTLAAGEDGPLDTVYQVQADVDRGAGVELMAETITLHVINRATTLGVMFSQAAPKPMA